MNAGLNKILIICLCAAGFFACKKEGSFTQVKIGTKPAFSATDSVFAFTSADAGETAVTYSWTASDDWGYKAVVNYSLQIDEKGNGFTRATEISVGAGTLKKEYTVAALNQIINNMGLAAGRQHELVIRVKAAVDTVGDEIFSDSISLTVTPYYVPKVYNSVYLPGGYEGWSFDDPRLGSLASVNNDKTYEGYVYFPDANTEFKVTTAKSWDVNYGDGGGGALSSGGGNMKAATAGYYRITANLNALTWTITATTWSIAGSAVGTDKAMTYNSTTGEWSATVSLSAGSFYFRANNADAIALSDDDNNGVLTAGSAGAISIATAGTYTVTMNLGNAGNYVYTLTAL
ncbi:MAG TPA: SusE domain-containing protein [Chitinophaga sp.]|nr:SusE domain-containing protein [Chitinophaga sp.]